MNGWHYVLLAACVMVFWALVVLGVVALIRYIGRGSRAATVPQTAEQVLAERFARGDIDEQEYRHRFDLLNGATGPDVVSTVTRAFGSDVQGGA